MLNKISLILLLLILTGMSLQFIYSKSIKLQWQSNEAYLMRFQWLDSANLYLKTGKILMLPQNNRLEDLSTGEDQGYPFLMSILGKGLGIREMNFGFFIQFNYLLLITLGIMCSLLVFVVFKSIFLTSLFYFLYLELGIYNGGIDHHWIIGSYIIFCILYNISLIRHKSNFPKSLLIIYFLIAGLANVIREGDGLTGILILSVSVIIIIGWKYKNIPKYPILKFKILLFGIFLISMFFLPTALLKLARYQRDLSFFNGKSSDMITHHGLWHNAFMGLGYIPNNYGIQWSDNNPIKFVHLINPETGYMTNDYYNILRGLYFKYSFESPNLWYGNILAKARTINKLNGEFTNNSPGKFLPQVLRNYFLYISLFGILLLSRKDKSKTAIFWLILVSLLISSIPGFIGTPTILYLEGLQSAFFMTWFYLGSLGYIALKDILKRHWPNQTLLNIL